MPSILSSITLTLAIALSGQSLFADPGDPNDPASERPAPRSESQITQLNENGEMENISADDADSRLSRSIDPSEEVVNISENRIWNSGSVGDLGRELDGLGSDPISTFNGTSIIGHSSMLFYLNYNEDAYTEPITHFVPQLDDIRKFVENAQAIAMANLKIQTKLKLIAEAIKDTEVDSEDPFKVNYLVDQLLLEILEEIDVIEDAFRYAYYSKPDLERTGATSPDFALVSASQTRTYHLLTHTDGPNLESYSFRSTELFKKLEVFGIIAAAQQESVQNGLTVSSQAGKPQVDLAQLATLHNGVVKPLQSIMEEHEQTLELAIRWREFASHSRATEAEKKRELVSNQALHRARLASFKNLLGGIERANVSTFPVGCGATLDKGLPVEGPAPQAYPPASGRIDRVGPNGLGVYPRLPPIKDI